MPFRIPRAIACTIVIVSMALLQTPFSSEARAQEPADELTPGEMALVRDVENRRIEVIEKVVGSVIAVYGPSRQGGGSGVIIDPSGIALTNHHVIEGAGLKGLGGLNDGRLYEWDLIGTDPGGDVAIIRMKGRDRFPWSPLGDSDKVRVGDMALAMGNPFLLAHDQVPTVTLGVVSGVERFQEGSGSNQLVYGNCIQIDSSINPGNSGGPLFNMSGEVIGINGRGSFRDRGRVNVGLGYAISSNQIRNFIPDLLASKIVEHGTLDAAFANRGGKVVCSTIDLDSAAAMAGLELGDELLEFEGQTISYANQFKNLICTYPEDWPAHLVVRKKDGRELTINVRMYGLPYNFQPREEPEQEQPRDGEDDPENPPGEDEPSEQPADNSELMEFLLHEAGAVIDYEVNSRSVEFLMRQWREFANQGNLEDPRMALKVTDEIRRDESVIGTQVIYAVEDGRFRLEHHLQDSEPVVYVFDGRSYWQISDSQPRLLDLVEAKTRPVLTQAMALLAPLQENPFGQFGKAILDGGDKARQSVSSRIMFLDEDDDWFFCWLSQYDDAGIPQVRLLKMSADKDCARNPGITLGDYRLVNGIRIPWQKRQVRGLAEKVDWTANTQSVDVLPSIDESLFTVSESSPK